MSWSRKNTTLYFRMVALISSRTASERGCARSTPLISAPICGSSGLTVNCATGSASSLWAVLMGAFLPLSRLVSDVHVQSRVVEAAAQSERGEGSVLSAALHEEDALPVGVDVEQVVGANGQSDVIGDGVTDVEIGD